MSREQVRFLHVRIAGENEGVDTLILIGPQLGQNLVRRPDDGRTASGTCASDASPQIFLDKPVSARCAKPFLLALDAIILGVDAAGISATIVELARVSSISLVVHPYAQKLSPAPNALVPSLQFELGR